MRLGLRHPATGEARQSAISRFSLYRTERPRELAATEMHRVVLISDDIGIGTEPNFAYT